MKMAQKLGVAVYVVVCFNQQLASLEAQEFFDYILVQKLKACQLVVGHDFAMGRNRVGDIRWLRERISTRVIHSFELDGQRVSSTLIRQCLAEGQMHRVYEYLGRPYAITGVVVGGQKLGQALGFPTINLARAGDFVLPADGIYAGRCTTSYGVYKAAISVGIRPAIGGQHRVIEAYLLDYPGYSLYGNAVSLEFLEWLREERYFATLEALREQIAQDVIAVRERI
jgi:riboflavin kinase/FMN adenylyltransferase